MHLQKHGQSESAYGFENQIIVMAGVCAHGREQHTTPVNVDKGEVVYLSSDSRSGWMLHIVITTFVEEICGLYMSILGKKEVVVFEQLLLGVEPDAVAHYQITLNEFVGNVPHDAYMTMILFFYHLMKEIICL